MRIKIICIWAVFIVLFLLCSSCSEGGEQTEPQSERPSATVSTTHSPTPTPTQTPLPESVEITVAGSTSVGPIVEALAEMYTVCKPYVNITVEQLGSGAGIQSCGDGTVDIGLSARELKEDERAWYPEMAATRLCIEAVAIIVNSENPTESLTAEQVKAIFMGEVTDWQDIGGAGGEIHLFGDPGSNIGEAFQTLFLGTDASGDQIEIDYTLLTETDLALMGHYQYPYAVAVGQDPAGITFMSLGNADQVEGIKVLTVDGVTPTAQSVLSGEYGYYRSFDVLTMGKPRGEVAAFIEFCLTDPGAVAFMEEKGFITG